MNQKHINSLVTIFLSLIFSIACNRTKDSAIVEKTAEILPDDIVELRSDQITLAKIELGTVEMKPLGNTIKVNGTISVEPQNFATVCMPFGGFIKSTTLFAGNGVHRGQVLATIENQDFVDVQQAYLEAKNKLVFTEADFKRHTDLYKNDVYSEQNVQQVTVEYKNLKALVKSLEQKLILIGINPSALSEDNISSTVNLVSPIDGFLKSVNVNIGKYVTSSEVLFEIVNNDKLILELSFFEKDASKLLKGQKVKFFINNEPDVHEAIITQTGKSVGQDKTFKVYATVSSQCKNLLPGMYVSALVSESDAMVTVLPSDAIVSFDDKDFIFVFDKEKVEAGKNFTEYKMIEVKKGVSNAGFTEVKIPEEINLNTAKIVRKGAYSILSAKKNAGEMAC
jgi:membrane fusion protein, heavy metal efflux system